MPTIKRKPEQSPIDRLMTAGEVQKWIWPVLLVQLLSIAVPWLVSDNLLMKNGQVAGSDFIVFYTAAKMALAGDGLVAYELKAFMAQQKQVVPGVNLIYPWLYPPGVLAAMSPLGALSYGAAYLVWNIISASIFAFGCYRLLPGRLTIPVVLAVPVVMVCVLHGQVSLILAGLLALMFRFMIDRKLLMAGIMLGLMTLKPQIALWFGLPILAFRLWPMLGGAIIGSLILHGLGFVVFGVDGIRIFLEAGQNYSTTFKGASLQFPKIPTLVGFVATFDKQMAQSVALASLTGGMFAVLVFSLKLHRMRQMGRTGLAGPEMYFFAMLVAVIWISIPYLYHYDLTIAVPAVLVMLELQRRAGIDWPDWLGKAVIVLSVFPMIVVGMNKHLGWFPNIAVLGGIALGIIIARLAGPLIAQATADMKEEHQKLRRLKRKGRAEAE
ncbi:MAG: hypothetical protein Alpg2KO_20920 [Alphaproteobacteria bacterium]